MEVMEAIRTRRSVRRYMKKPVSKETICGLLEAANLAPTATNQQPWGFAVANRSYLDRLEEILNMAFTERVSTATEEAVREAIKDLAIPVDKGEDKLAGLGRFYRTLGDAPVAIAVHIPKETDSWVWKNNVSDAAAAIENLLLAAWSQGLGTCWMTGPLRTRADDIGRFLEIPKDREIVALVTLGYVRQTPKCPPKADVMSKVRWLWIE